ncbi:MAG: Hsp33 family molecular chaperone HslO [Thermoanaerobaculia bacterium]
MSKHDDHDSRPEAVPAATAGAALDGELRLGVAADGDLRWAAADVAGPLEEARYRLDLSPVSAVALGRALAAATLLLRFTTKASGRLLVEVLGDGPLGKIVAEADGQGHLRGRVEKPQLATPDGGDMAIGWAVGKGLLRVTREGERGRYTGQVELVSGEMGRDLVHYLEQSQQIRSAALLGVLPRPTGIAAAGGVLIEAFPGTPDDTLAKLESNIAALEGVSAYLADGGIAALRDAVLDGFDRDDLERHRLAYSCRCSRDTLLAQLQGLSTADVETIVDDSGYCVAECAFCGTTYRFPSDELATH